MVLRTIGRTQYNPRYTSKGMGINSRIRGVQGMGMGVENTRTRPNFARYLGVGTERVANPACDDYEKRNSSLPHVDISTRNRISNIEYTHHYIL